jgi:putative ABC transport system permease protein
MSEFKLVLKYGWRLVSRQWRRFVLPFLSLFITAVVVMLILLLTNASSLLLSNQARELTGGDVVVESNTKVDIDEFWQKALVEPKQMANQLSFSGTLQSKDSVAPFSVQVVDQNYPLYGEVRLKSDKFSVANQADIFLDQAGATKLNVSVGDEILFGTKSFRVAGIIEVEPTSLFGGFRFLPRAIMSTDGFNASGIDSALLRVEYIYAAKFDKLSKEQIAGIKSAEETYGRDLDVDVAGVDRTGLQRGLQIVTDFLVVAVLITSVLAAVNVYSSTLYLVTVERKSLAILLALGMRKRLLTIILGYALLCVVVSAGVMGILAGSIVFSLVGNYINASYAISLPTPGFVLDGLLCLFLMLTIAVSSFTPAVRKSLALNPKQILIGGDEALGENLPFRNLSIITGFTLLPLVVLAVFLLESLVDGVLVIGAITISYVVVALVFVAMLALLYKKRQTFNFFIRSIISQKKADGLFGVVSFTSLFIALAALGTLTLIQVSLERYLTQDLARTVPTTYVLDIQASQKEAVSSAYPDLQLFANIQARIIAIDDLYIQDELARDNPAVDRELGREFNLTSRNELLSSETIVSGVWSEGRSGEISVDTEFANRANIKLGSKLVFSVQGFAIGGVVTSLRETDSRSGLPFFYFVLSPEDIGMFPSVYFGYSYYEAERQQELSRFLATEMPNVSLLETQSIGPIIVKLIGTLMVLVYIIALPPLLIATLLITTLVVSSYGARRREGARLRAIGATRKQVLLNYLGETISLTLVASVLSYLFSLGIAYAISNYFLGIESVVIFDADLAFGLALIIVLVGLVGLYLFKTDTMPLRELLSYESSN